jgi:hypothetical protein
MRPAACILPVLCLCISLGCDENKRPKRSSTETGDNQGAQAAGSAEGGGTEARKLPPPEKWDGSYLEKQWGLKLKSVTYTDPPGYQTEAAGTGRAIGPVQVTCLFEFVKDAEDVKAVREAFGIPPTPPLGDPSWRPAVAACFFDEENVLIYKLPAGAMVGSAPIEGEITGRKGDAFRMVLGIGAYEADHTLSKAKKVEFRPVETPGK